MGKINYEVEQHGEKSTDKRKKKGEKKTAQPLIELRLFSWLGELIVLKPSLVSAPTLFLWVIKTNKPWDQTKTSSGRKK